MSFPDDSIQSVCGFGDWWESFSGKKAVRGSLIRAYVAYPSQEPLVLEPIGRKNPREHEDIHIEIKKLKISARKPIIPLPTAGLTLNRGECWAGYRAKVRPCLVLGCQPFSTGLSKGREKMMAKHLRETTILVAPYYGADQDGSRGGYPEEFVENIRHARCSQLFCDQLPHSSKVENSILRFDHIQTIGAHSDSYELMPYKLSESALRIMDEWIEWYMQGVIYEKSEILEFQELIKEYVTSS